MHKGNAYLVTGANGHLGRALVGEIANQGDVSLVLATRSKEISPVVSFPDRVRMLHVGGLDLSHERDAAELADRVAGFLPHRFDVLNSVGAFPGYRTVLELSGEEALEVYKSNYLTVYNVARAIMPLLKERGGGNFVAFTSHSRYQAYPLMAAFESAKAALEQLVRHLAHEEAINGITVNAFALSTLATTEEFRLKPHGDHEHWPLPEEVAREVLRTLSLPGGLLNGNIIHLYKYSRTYFHSSYFERIEP